jgi:hypothetical protein
LAHDQHLGTGGMTRGRREQRLGASETVLGGASSSRSAPDMTLRETTGRRRSTKKRRGEIATSLGMTISLLDATAE